MRFSRFWTLLVVWLALGIVIGPRGVDAQSRRKGARGSVRKERSVGNVASYVSTNFRVVTDLPEEQAQELVERLETMLKLVAGYFGKKNIRTIDMYVAKDLTSWPQEVLQTMDPDGMDSILNGAGVTMNTTSLVNGRAVDAVAVVYAVADHGTPQHEAVHAYCNLAFGACGPVWYAEGMAEVGQYWREGDQGVNAHPEVIRYLRRSDPKPLGEIVNNPLETTGDSWQNYAWRWALCHLLGHNTNYSDRFKPLGLAMLNRQSVDFTQVYGEQAAEVAFEYDFFLRHVESGYRVDLCSWDWKSKAAPPRSSGTTSRIDAGKGWQSAKVTLTAGQAYDFDANGEWTLTDDGAAVSADGDAAGEGRLVGCLFSNYQLSPEFELGRRGTLTAERDGTLFLRCRDGWGSLGDNKGTLTVKLRPAAK
ncbi:MAG: hypothetical protein ACK5Q5_16010 [Planctomycetaceae bacterium]